MSSARNEFTEHVMGLMSGWATVTARRMFGGYGVYREGLMFALVAEDELFFKADAGNVAQFEQAGSHPFVYQSRARTVQMTYWSAPEASLESPAEMGNWCQSAYGAALRTQAAKAGKPGKGKHK